MIEVKHLLVVTNDGATVSLRHEGCPGTSKCPYAEAWRLIRLNMHLMPQPAPFKHYEDGEHEMQLTISGKLQGKNTAVPWRERFVQED